MKEFSGKTCVVSGAAGGIGSAVCKKFAENGANVVLLDVDESALDAAVKKIGASEGTILPIVVDLQSVASIRNVMEQVEQKLGAVHVLVTCAGVTFNCDVLDFEEKDWDLVQNVNLKSVLFLAQAAARSMVKYNVEHGHIVLTSSQAGVVGEPGSHAYGSSKAGVSMLTQTLALDLAKHGIAVSAVAPGTINTGMIQRYFTISSEMQGISKEDFANSVINNIPMKRMGEPEEVAELMYFLASSKADYITGGTHNITGGSMNV